MGIIGNALKIITIVLIFIFITLFFQFKAKREEIIRNWDKYKDDPMVLLFSGILNPQIDPEKAFNDLVQKNSAGGMSSHLSSLTNNFSQIGGTINIQSEMVGNLTGVFDQMMVGLVGAITGIIDRLMNIWEAVRFIFIKLRAMVNRLFAVISIAYYSFISIALSLEWLWNVPRYLVLVFIIICLAVGWMLCMMFTPVCYLLGILIAGVGGMAVVDAASGTKGGGGRNIGGCFSGSTKVPLSDGSYRRIDQLQIGDLLWGNNTVNGLLKVIAPTEQMYYLPTENLIVSGDHLVYYPSLLHTKQIPSEKLQQSQKWLRVEQLPTHINNQEVCVLLSSLQLQELGVTQVYCPLTEFGFFPVCQQQDNSTSSVTSFLWAQDYNGVNHPIWQQWWDKKIDHINHISISKNTSITNDNSPWNEMGVISNTPIKMANHQIKAISELQIGDQLGKGRGGKVLGIIKLDLQTNSNTSLYQYHHIIGTASSICQSTENGSYHRFHQLGKEISELDIKTLTTSSISKPSHLYQLLTSEGIWYSQGIMMRDFTEVDNLDLLEPMENCAQQFLNHYWEKKNLSYFYKTNLVN